MIINITRSTCTMKNTQCNYTTKKNAFVLSLVLWIVAAMMLLALLFVRLAKEESNIYRQMHHKLTVELASESLFEKLSFYVATGTFSETTVQNKVDGLPPKISLDKRDYNTSFQKSTCYYSLLDHSALFNLRNMGTLQQAQRFIEQNSKIHYPLAPIYLDWIDPDDLTRLNGAEKSDYLLDGYNYTPDNFVSFQHPDSIFLLKDFNNIDKNSTDIIKKHFTTYGRSSVNIYLLDQKMLKAFFPQLNNAEIEKLFLSKESDPKEYYEKFSFLPYEGYGKYPSKVVSFHIDCKKENANSKLDVVIDFHVNKEKSWTILLYDKH